MRKTQNVTILLLICTAGVLTAMLAMMYIQTAPLPAQAGASEGVRGGSYIVGTATARQGLDVVYIVDAQRDGMNVYFLNPQTRSIQKVTGMEFSKVQTFNQLIRE